MSIMNKSSRFKYYFSIAGILFITGIILISSLPEDMGGVANVSADFGTPSGYANAKITQIAILNQNNGGQIAKWTESNDDELIKVDYNYIIQSVGITVNLDSHLLYSHSYDIAGVASDTKVTVTITKDNVTVNNYNATLIAYSNGIWYDTCQYQVKDMNYILVEDSYYEIDVKLYVRMPF